MQDQLTPGSSLGKFLLDRMEARGLTIEDVIAASQMSPYSPINRARLTRVITGNVAPSPALLEKLRDVLEIPLGDLLVAMGKPRPAGKLIQFPAPSTRS